MARTRTTTGPWQPSGGYECEACGETIDYDAMLVSRNICPQCGATTKFREAKVQARRRVTTTHCWGVGRIEDHWEYKEQGS